MADHGVPMAVVLDRLLRKALALDNLPMRRWISLMLKDVFIQTKTMEQCHNINGISMNMKGNAIGRYLG